MFKQLFKSKGFLAFLLFVGIGVIASVLFTKAPKQDAPQATTKQTEQKPADSGLAAGAQTPAEPEAPANVADNSSTSVAGQEPAKKAVLGMQKPKASQKEKSKTDAVADSLLKNAPTAATPQPSSSDLPGSLNAGQQQPETVASAAPVEAATPNSLLEQNPTAAGAGDAPVANNVTSPTTTNLPSGGLQAPAALVPETSTWMMMLAGLGMLAVGVRRKK